MILLLTKINKWLDPDPHTFNTDTKNRGGVEITELEILVL
jgi:hypothetical protein